MNDAALVADGRRGRGVLWHHHDFRRLWIGETVSQAGSQITFLALPLIAVLAVHASTFEVALLTTFETAAFLFVGLPAGAWVDRMRFRLVLIVNDLLRAAAMGSIPLAALVARVTIEQLYAVALVVGACTVFFDVAYQSYLPELVEREAIVEGNAKLQASESVAQVAGPGVGGLLIQAITAPYALVVDAASFVWSAAWIAAIRARPPMRERPAERSLVREIREGLAFVVHHRSLRAIAACTGTSNLLGSASTALIYVLLAREVGLSPGVIGLLSSTAAIGGLLGALIAPRVAERLGQGPAIWGSALVCAVPLYATPFVHRDWTIGLYAVAQTVEWVAVVVYNITQVSYRQGLCPPDLLGRMNATMRFLVWGTLPLGALIGGALGSTIGVRATLLTVAVLGIVPFLPVYFSPLRHARRLPGQEQPATATVWRATRARTTGTG